ncbi:acyl-CoA thioesterase [Brevibacterium litoralis]|uniref:acyl-CoA thioesterase n=1 Tax=Brevibacterium litoralis TaxID=3138935 RepID=UPI0032EDC746
MTTDALTTRLAGDDRPAEAAGPDEAPLPFRLPLNWKDPGFAGHLFHAEYIVLADQGRVRWLDESLRTEYARRHLMAHLAIDYVAEVSQPTDHLFHHIRVEKVGNTSIRLRETFTDHAGTVVMRLLCVLLLLDRETHRPVPVPDVLRARMVPFLLEGQDLTALFPAGEVPSELAPEVADAKARAVTPKPTDYVDPATRGGMAGLHRTLDPEVDMERVHPPTP